MEEEGYNLVVKHINLLKLTYLKTSVLGIGMDSFGSLKTMKTGIILPFAVIPSLCVSTCMMAWVPGVLNIPLAFIWLIMSKHLMTYKKRARNDFMQVLGTLAFMIGLPHLIPTFIVFAIYMEIVKNKSSGNIMLRGFLWLEDLTSLPFRFTTGGHSGNQLLEDLKRILSVMVIPDIQPMAVARRLRSNGIDAFPEASPEAPFMEPESAKREIARTEMRNRWFLIMVTLVVVTVYRGALHPFMIAPFIVAMVMRPAESEEVVLGKTERTMANGIYAIDYYGYFGMYRTTCIGTVHEGVLHVPYHAVGRVKLHFGDILIEPFYINPGADLVTWGGYPRFSKIEDGDTLYANHEPDQEGMFCGHGTRVIAYESSKNGRSFTWTGQSQPGQSGSPVWRRDESGLHLVAMVGRWLQDDGRVVEFAEIPEMYSENIPEVTGNTLTKETGHPGSGKTRHKIPACIGKSLYASGKHGDRKAYVIGPTRTVANEIYDALAEKFPGHVGLAIHESGRSNMPRMPVQVTTHSTFMVILQKNRICMDRRMRKSVSNVKATADQSNYITIPKL